MKSRLAGLYLSILMGAFASNNIAFMGYQNKQNLYMGNSKNCFTRSRKKKILIINKGEEKK